MNRCELADSFHKKGFNCCQSVLLAFADRAGLDEQTCMNLAGGFGSGTGTGELCGAISGAVMALGLLTPVDPADPVGSKKRTTALSKEFQRRFSEKFGAVRCQDLLQRKLSPEEIPACAQALGLTGHCAIMVATAAEIVDEMLAERG